MMPAFSTNSEPFIRRLFAAGFFARLAGLTRPLKAGNAFSPPIR